MNASLIFQITKSVLAINLDGHGAQPRLIAISTLHNLCAKSLTLTVA